MMLQTLIWGGLILVVLYVFREVYYSRYQNGILTRVHKNLRLYLKSPALGDVKPKLQNLVNHTGTVDRKCRRFLRVSSFE